MQLWKLFWLNYQSCVCGVGFFLGGGWGVCVNVCTEWPDSRMWLSACLNQEYTGCVSALRSVCGPLRQASGFRLHAPIGCFCWTKTQPELGPLLKKQRHFCALWRNRPFRRWLHHISLMTHFCSDEMVSRWWDHLCVINIWMESEYVCCSDGRHVLPFLCALEPKVSHHLAASRENKGGVWPHGQLCHGTVRFSDWSIWPSHLSIVIYRVPPSLLPPGPQKMISF